MRARMITSLAGPEGLVDPGKVIDGPDARIQELIDGGYAEPLEGKGVEEATTFRLRELAVAPAARRKGKSGEPAHPTA